MKKHANIIISLIQLCLIFKMLKIIFVRDYICIRLFSQKKEMIVNTIVLLLGLNWLSNYGAALSPAERELARRIEAWILSELG